MIEANKVNMGHYVTERDVGINPHESFLIHQKYDKLHTDSIYVVSYSM